MKNIYESPLNSRYASKEMSEIFSPDTKFKTWRKLWVVLAQAEKELGLDITDEQIEELIKFKDDINYDVAAEKEKEIRHDVMAHIFAYGQQCPKAKPIIHLGATSCYVGDNTDIIVMTEALKLIRAKVVSVISKLSDFAIKNKDLPTLGFTHFQAAQLTTVGKRACLWIQDLMIDFEQINCCINNMKLLGSKGTTGTQASFMELFNNDTEKVKKLDKLIAEKLGFKDVFAVSGQTYTRKLDSIVANVLSGVAQSCTKFSNDMRLLQHLKEIEEPFEKNQVGSSAMAYKRNPMRSERIAGLARYIMINALNPAVTASAQWFERTLDDSSNKRIAIPEMFLAADAILNIYINIAENIVVYPKVIISHIMAELPFMATENIIMDAVKAGGDRQVLHEKIRKHSMKASEAVKVYGGKNDLIERIANDDTFGLSIEQLNKILAPKNFIGRAPQQVEEYINEQVKPVIEKNKNMLINHSELTV